MAGATEGARSGVHRGASRLPVGPQALRLPPRGSLLAAQRRNTGHLVGEWAAHTVEVLYRIYAHCLDGDDERWFTRMEDALG